MASQPLNTYTVYCFYVLFTKNQSDVRKQENRSIRQVFFILVAEAITVCFLYIIPVLFLQTYPNLSEMCSIFTPASNKGHLNGFLLSVMLLIYVTSNGIAVMLFMRLHKKVGLVKFELETFDSNQTIKNTSFVIRKLSLVHVFLPGMWGLIAFGINMSLLLGWVPGVGKDWYLISVLYPVWTLLNPAVYCFQNHKKVCQACQKLHLS